MSIETAAVDIERRYLTYSEASRYSGLSTATLRRMVESEQLRICKVGERLLRFDRRDLDRLFHSDANSSSVHGG